MCALETACQLCPLNHYGQAGLWHSTVKKDWFETSKNDTEILKISTSENRHKKYG